MSCICSYSLQIRGPVLKHIPFFMYAIQISKWNKYAQGLRVIKYSLEWKGNNAQECMHLGLWVLHNTIVHVHRPCITCKSCMACTIRIALISRFIYSSNLFILKILWVGNALSWSWTISTHDRMFLFSLQVSTMDSNLCCMIWLSKQIIAQNKFTQINYDNFPLKGQKLDAQKWNCDIFSPERKVMHIHSIHGKLETQLFMKVHSIFGKVLKLDNDLFQLNLDQPDSHDHIRLASLAGLAHINNVQSLQHWSKFWKVIGTSFFLVKRSSFYSYLPRFRIISSNFICISVLYGNIILSPFIPSFLLFIFYCCWHHTSLSYFCSPSGFNLNAEWIV